MKSSSKKLLIECRRILHPLSSYDKQCHVASLALVKAGLASRVARGWRSGIISQHSWAVVGDCYNPALIIDATLWSYQEGKTPSIHIADSESQLSLYKPHGAGSIWDWGRPIAGNGLPIPLTPTFDLSKIAKRFLDLLGPLDREGWMNLSRAPVMGWPSREIIAAMDDTEELECLVPIDILGMLTDRNPGGLYLASGNQHIDRRGTKTKILNRG